MIPIAICERSVQNTFYKIQNECLKSVAVTATQRQEGVSVFSYALARRASTAGLNVLLIDFNLNHPVQGDFLALECSNWDPDSDFHDKNIQTLSNTNLSVLTAPEKIRNYWPFQDKAKMRMMIERLHQDFDLIIADMPSILNHEMDIQVEILCSGFDASLLMVLSGETMEPDIAQASDLMNKAGVRILGSIINDRYTPTLANEIKREIDRFLRRFPGLCRTLNKHIDESAFLNQVL